MAENTKPGIDKLFEESAPNFPHWEKIKDVIDQLIDLAVNFRQSGHPGGSRSKVHAMVSTLLSGAMHWDIRHPEKRFGDRFILSAGHTVPLVYATLGVFCDAMRTMYERTGDSKYFIPQDRAVLWEDFLCFRRCHGLPGHAEMEGKTLFLKANTGPSGHGVPIAAGEALTLKRAGAEQVKVFALEGDGGLTPGGVHETFNSAYGLGLSNLVFVVDWNDYGIDDHKISAVQAGTPDDWFGAHGWRTFGALEGEDWGEVTKVILQATYGDNPDSRPSMAWSKTKKGRGYYKYDNKSHGSPHKQNSDLFWKCRKDFADKYGVAWDGYGEPPRDYESNREQYASHLNTALSIIRNDEACLRYLTDRLISLGDSVPETLPLRISLDQNPFKDPELLDFEHYPATMWEKPGAEAPNRAGLAKWGAWVNTWARKKYNRPLFLACSADLADSTNISGFAHDFDGVKGWGWFDRVHNLDGVLLPQEITEFANAGICCGAASVNLAPNPFDEWNGFMTACSTYGSFVYLKYGLFRLYSQMAQDTQFKLGKILWVAGHSGPETADDSRTHFGIFAPGITQLFPEGHVIDVHPWEHNEVPVVIAAGLASPSPIIALHLTRPPVTVPDRAALGIASHFDAAKGAYVLRAYRDDQPKAGCIFVQGSVTTKNTVSILSELTKNNLNVKIVAAISPQLFALQPAAYREQIITQADRIDSTMISNRCRRVGSDWMFNPLAAEYAMTSDWDNRWRTGGTLEDVVEEARLSPDDLLEGIERFVKDRPARLARVRDMLNQAEHLK